MLSDYEMWERMVRGWRAGRPETDCGNGSLLSNTVRIREWLPELVQRHGIRSVCDAGAGDMHWVSRLEWSVKYRAFDLIVRHAQVEPLDITREVLPQCDAILCRMVLNHLDAERNLLALGLFKLAARFLIATQFNGENLPQRSPQFTRLDLRRPPYSLGEPLESVPDGGEQCCTLALWHL